MKNNGFRSFPRACGRALLSLAAGLMLGALSLTLIVWLKMRGDHPEVNLLWAAEIAAREGLLPLLTGGLREGPLALLGRGAPTALLALGISLAGQAGMLQLGGAGMYALGAAAAMLCASVPRLPWYACLAAAALAGGLWGAVPGVLKARLQLREALGTALSAWLALYALQGLSPLLSWEAQPRQTELYGIAPLIAGGLALLIWMALRLTVAGLETRLLGESAETAVYAGMNTGRTAFLVLCLSGLLCGAAGGMAYVLGDLGQVPDLSLALTGAGLHGLTAAALAGWHPAGAVCMAAAVQYLSSGAEQVNGALFPPESGDLVLSLILYFSAFAVLTCGRRVKGGRKA